MKRKIITILMALAMTLSLAACGAGEETTLTGMVVSVDGTVISLVEMDAGTMDFSQGEMPEGMESFQGFGGFDPGAFDGSLPEGETFPQRGEGGMMPPEGMDFPEGMTMPEGMEFPEDMTMPDGMDLPEDMTMPDGMDLPEDMTMPENGRMPGGFSEDMETKDVDVSAAHISVEIDGGKEGGSMDSVTPGSFVTITLNGKGEATYVLVSPRSGFSGFGSAA